MKVMRIIEANRELQKELDSFYIEQGYHGGWSNLERAFVCLFENKIVGAVKFRIHGKRHNSSRNVHKSRIPKTRIRYNPVEVY